MSDQVISRGQVETPEAHARGVVEAPAEFSQATPAGRVPSYMPTGVRLLDSLLETVDGVTKGKAGVLQRAVSYLIVGGFAAVTNLVFLYLLYNVIQVPFSDFVHYNAAFVLAAEISILANFIPNDRITFSRLPGHARSWWQRCWRFHSTAIAGTLITFTVSSGLKWGLHWAVLLAQSTAIIIALVFNFTFHHVWTYRHISPAH
jgi:putative flippase GtrA